METTKHGPSPEERHAQDSILKARQTEDAVRKIDTPWWYFILSAALFAALNLTQLLGDKSTVAMFAVGMAIVALNLLAARRAGVMGAGSRNRGFLSALFLIFVVIFGSLVWFGATGNAWVVVAAAATAAVLMLIGGWLYRRNPS